MYHVKEAFYTLQGEGAQAGRASVFCRFTGCNLWSGREIDRANAKCTFCDTDFNGTDGVNGGRFNTAQALAEHIKALWPQEANNAVPYVVFTGGEPLLQLDTELMPNSRDEQHGRQRMTAALEELIMNAHLVRWTAEHSTPQLVNHLFKAGARPNSDTFLGVTVEAVLHYAGGWVWQLLVIDLIVGGAR